MHGIGVPQYLQQRIGERHHQDACRVGRLLRQQNDILQVSEGEKPLNPFQQEWIRQLFRRYGYNDDFAFDNTKEVYIFD